MPQCFNAAPQYSIVTAADSIAIAQHSIAMAQHLKLRGDNASAAAQPTMLSIHNATVIEKLRIFTRHISICSMHNASFIGANQSFTLCNGIAGAFSAIGLRAALCLQDHVSLEPQKSAGINHITEKPDPAQYESAQGFRAP